MKYFVVLPQNKKYSFMRFSKYLILSFLVFSFASCDFSQKAKDVKENAQEKQTLDWEKIGKGIVERETKQLPITIQELDGVTEIAIDSFVLVNEIEPYSGYLVTHWKMVKPDYNSHKWNATREINPQVIVEVEDIQFEKDKFSWQTDWHNAYMHVRFNNEEY